MRQILSPLYPKPAYVCAIGGKLAKSADRALLPRCRILGGRQGELGARVGLDCVRLAAKLCRVWGVGRVARAGRLWNSNGLIQIVKNGCQQTRSVPGLCALQE